MFKNICIYITFITLFLLLPFDTFAMSVDSYLVTDTLKMDVPSGQRVYYYKNIFINYQSGRIVLSRNPDGTGEGLVGESIDASVSGENFEYKTDSSSCNGAISMKPLDITHLLNPGPNNLLVRFRTVWCSHQTVDPVYVVHFNDYEPTTEPFLDLPWDYTSKNMSFEDAATKVSAYFDHEYPLLSAEWFLREPSEYSHDLVKFDGSKGEYDYSRHDAYDYAAISNAYLNDPVLAAASGVATFHNNCSACGNAIHIDHGNGYQTRYYHLQPDGLITNNSNERIQVNSRQQIGKIGFSGAVRPSGAKGAHIHFMLIQDKNGDGNFNDNIPDGIVDPYGWQSSEPDPWEQFTFQQDGKERSGVKSTYLWKHSLDGITRTLSTEGGTYRSNRFTFTFPTNATDKDLIVSLKPVSVSEPSAQLVPIGYVLNATATDGFGNFVTEFNKAFKLSMRVLLSDFSRYIPESLSIYSSSDGINWHKEETTVDLENRIAEAEVDHFTQFAFMGEKIDSIAPISQLLVNDEAVIEEGIYYEPIHISLRVSDEPTSDSLGIEHSFIRVNNTEWSIYNQPIELSDIGEHSIEYYSVDKDGNREEMKSTLIGIQEQPAVQPELQIMFNKNTKLFEVTSVDEDSVITTELIQKKNKVLTEYISYNDTGKTVLTTYNPDKNKKNVLRLKSIQYDEDEPLILDKYRIVASEKFSRNDVAKLVQVFKHGDEEKVRLTYNERKDKTKVIIKSFGEIITTQELDGFKKLFVSTNNYNIGYSIK